MTRLTDQERAQVANMTPEQASENAKILDRMFTIAAENGQADSFQWAREMFFALRERADA